MLTTHAHCVLITVCCSLRAACCSLLPVHSWLLATPRLLLTAYNSILLVDVCEVPIHRSALQSIPQGMPLLDTGKITSGSTHKRLVAIEPNLD